MAKQKLMLEDRKSFQVIHDLKLLPMQFRNGTTALHECIPLGENGAAPLKILLKFVIKNKMTWMNSMNRSLFN